MRNNNKPEFLQTQEENTSKKSILGKAWLVIPAFLMLVGAYHSFLFAKDTVEAVFYNTPETVEVSNLKPGQVSELDLMCKNLNVQKDLCTRYVQDIVEGAKVQSTTLANGSVYNLSE